MIPADTLRPPAPGDPTAASYRDWLHVNVFDHAGDRTGLVNVSVHGPPGDPRTLVVAASVLDVGGREWVGDVVPYGWDEAVAGLGSLATPSAVVSLLGEQVAARAGVRDLDVEIAGRPRAPALEPGPPQEFGSGWIGWRLVPRLDAFGSLGVRGSPGRQVPLVAYHDHNWGRWHWGEDVGWEWGTFAAPPGEPDATVVLARTTDRAHARPSAPTVVLDAGSRRRVFDPGRCVVAWSGTAPVPTFRRPGALAALHADRRRPHLPGRLELSGRAGRDWVRLDFTCRATAQLVLPDPVVPGYAFLHELSGRFEASGRLGGEELAFTGLGIAELLA